MQPKRSKEPRQRGPQRGQSAWIAFASAAGATLVSQLGKETAEAVLTLLASAWRLIAPALGLL